MSRAQEEWASEAESGRTYKCQPGPTGTEAQTACVSPSLWATSLKGEGARRHMPTGDIQIRLPGCPRGWEPRTQNLLPSRENGDASAQDKSPPQRHTRQPSAARRSHEGAAEEEAEACVNADASPGAQLCARQVPSGHNCTCLGTLSAPGSFHPRVVGQPCVLGKHWSRMDSVGDESPVVGAGNLNPWRSQDSPRALQARPESRAAQEPVSLSCGVAGSVRGCQLPPGSRDWSQRKEALSSVNVTCSLSLLPASRSTRPGDGHPLSIYPESGSAPRDRPSPPLAGSSQTGKQSMQPKTRTRKRGMEREWG